MKNLIVFSLWGSEPIYWKGASVNIELAKKFYPDFVCRFYVDKNCDRKMIDDLNHSNTEVFEMEPGHYSYKNYSNRFNHNGIFWRFLPLKESNVNVILSRDCDSRISEREVLAVNEWLNSDKKFHLMRDHPYHQVPILSGMWGCRGGYLSNIDSLFQYWSDFPNKGRFQAEDQDFLGQVIYPLVKEDCLEHSEFDIKFNNVIESFPKERIDFEFVGDVFDENNQRHPDYWKIIKNKIIK